ncbi:MAG: hypothetical protein F4Z87_01135, partial [Gammaproteobacteria bacterium]|nr:hypothetical protein [Gammaproteobacteria bacterium]
MKTTLKLPPWLWASVVGIVLVTVSIALIYRLKPNYSVAPPSEGANLSNESKPVDSTLRTTSAEPLVAVETNSTPTLTYSIGTVEEACGIHEYPPYWDYLEDFEDSDHEELLMRAITSAECRDALDAHVGTMNPYLWGHPMVYVRQFAFVKIENPLTFDRVFTDPTGDFARVQFALSRSECLLENGTTTNFELKESCNADALLNYALLNRYCFHGEDSNRTYYNSDPTPEESKLMWKQDLEELWVRTKCKEFDSDLELTEARYPDLTKLLSSLADSDSLGLAMLNVERRRIAERPYPEILPSRFLIATLIDMAARLGDDAAALTFQWYGENGINLGRFKELELS